MDSESSSEDRERRKTKKRPESGRPKRFSSSPRQSRPRSRRSYYSLSSSTEEIDGWVKVTNENDQFSARYFQKFLDFIASEENRRDRNFQRRRSSSSPPRKAKSQRSESDSPPRNRPIPRRRPEPIKKPETIVISDSESEESPIVKRKTPAVDLAAEKEVIVILDDPTPNAVKTNLARTLSDLHFSDEKEYRDDRSQEKRKDKSESRQSRKRDSRERDYRRRYSRERDERPNRNGGSRERDHERSNRRRDSRERDYESLNRSKDSRERDYERFNRRRGSRDRDHERPNRKRDSRERDYGRLNRSKDSRDRGDERPTRKRDSRERDKKRRDPRERERPNKSRDSIERDRRDSRDRDYRRRDRERGDRDSRDYERLDSSRDEKIRRSSEREYENGRDRTESIKTNDRDSRGGGVDELNSKGQDNQQQKQNILPVTHETENKNGNERVATRAAIQSNPEKSQSGPQVQVLPRDMAIGLPPPRSTSLPGQQPYAPDLTNQKPAYVPPIPGGQQGYPSQPWQQSNPPQGTAYPPLPVQAPTGNLPPSHGLPPGQKNILPPTQSYAPITSLPSPRANNLPPTENNKNENEDQQEESRGNRGTNFNKTEVEETLKKLKKAEAKKPKTLLRLWPTFPESKEIQKKWLKTFDVDESMAKDILNLNSFIIWQSYRED